MGCSRPDACSWCGSWRPDLDKETQDRNLPVPSESVEGRKGDPVTPSYVHTTPEQIHNLAVQTAHQQVERHGKAYQVWCRTSPHDWRNLPDRGILHVDVLYFIVPADDAEPPRNARLILEVQP